MDEAVDYVVRRQGFRRRCIRTRTLGRTTFAANHRTESCPSGRQPFPMKKKRRLFRVLSGRRSQIEFPTVEVDGVDEVLLIAETARRGLDPLNP